MKKLMLTLLAVVLLLPSVAAADVTVLGDEEMDVIHAGGLQIFIDFNLFLPTVIDPALLEGLVDLESLQLTAEVSAEQTVGDGNSGTVLQNSIQLNGTAQQNLSALVNFNAVNSVIPMGINITVIFGDNLGSVIQDNLSLGLMNSSLFLGL